MCFLQPSASRGMVFVRTETSALAAEHWKALAASQGMCVGADVWLCVVSCLKVRTKLFLCSSFLSSARENSSFYLD